MPAYCGSSAPVICAASAVGGVLPVGQAGDLLTRGYCVMSAYWEDADKSAEAIDASHWIRSGDIAVLDEHGYCRIVGRIKDMLIRGGENIYPREIEEFLFTHPKVEDVQVIGVPDERFGEEICACIRLRPGQSASALVGWIPKQKKSFPRARKKNRPLEQNQNKALCLLLFLAVSFTEPLTFSIISER